MRSTSGNKKHGGLLKRHEMEFIHQYNTSIHIHIHIYIYIYLYICSTLEYIYIGQ